MGASGASDDTVRVLGLGNEILADDAFGIAVARELRRRGVGRAEVLYSMSAGFDLLDELLGVSRLIVVDTIMTGAAPPGTLTVLRERDARPAPGSPHFVGLFEVLEAARRLQLAAPAEVIVIAVEASDCTTVGGAMHPDVRLAIGPAVELVLRHLNAAVTGDV